MYEITREKPQDAVAIDHLLDISFGEERFRKTAYAIRQNSTPIPELCLVARDESGLLATIQYWNLLIGDKTEAILLGPIAVRPAEKGKGIGIGLIRDTMKIAKDLGHKLVVLVGDPEYYGRFGFTSAFDRGLQLPGPVDAHRFLVCELEEGALDGVQGMVNGLRIPGKQVKSC